jgi:hypothetical protein
MDRNGVITRTPVDLSGLAAKAYWSIDGAASVSKTLSIEADQVNQEGEATYEIQDADLSGVTSESTMRVIGEVVDGSDNHVAIEYREITIRTVDDMLGVT